MKKFIILSAIILCAYSVHADSQYVGTTSANFLKIAPMARASAMGEAYDAVSEGTYGMYYNPGGIAYVLSYEFQLSHISWFQGINYEFASVVFPVPFVESSKMGVAVSWLQVDKIAQTSDISSYEGEYLNSGLNWDSFTEGYFSPYDYSVTLAYAIAIKEYLSTGVRIKLNSENIDSYSGYSFTSDIGMLYKMDVADHLLGFGITIMNLGTGLKLDEMTFDAPKMLNLGVSDKIELFGNDLTAAFQFSLHVDYDFLYAAGIEYWLQDIVALRAGYKFGAFNQPTFGVGLKIDKFELDYAFVNYDELGATHRFSFVYNWGSPDVKLKSAPDIISPNGDKFLDEVKLYPVIKSKEKIKDIRINIYDVSNRKRVHTIKIDDVNSTEIIWDGKSAGAVLPDGIYGAVMEVQYTQGTSRSRAVKIEIDNTPPLNSLIAEPKLLKPGKEDSLIIPAKFSFDASDRNGISKWQLVVWDYNKKVFYNAGGDGAPPSAYAWDGKGINGDYVRTGDIYYYSLITYDKLGNMGKSPMEHQVVLLKEIKLTFASDALFELGEANVKISAYSTLKKMRTVLDEFPQSKINVTGYTDDREAMGSEKYRSNTQLSKVRAEAVKFFMVNILGIEESRIVTSGKGEALAIADNSTPEGRTKNRRVEITITSTYYK